VPSKEPSLQLQDILDAIDMIAAFMHDMSFEQFREDPKTVAAVERKLLVVSEAAVRLGEEAPALIPEVPWRNIRGIGNWLRHQYDRVDVATVWSTVIVDLPPLAASIERVLSEWPPRPDGPKLG
jgi:uncharacterized protein with HEPN domain